MKKVKIFLDITMFILMIMLMRLNVTGSKLHETFGIIIFILFLFHFILNIKFIKTIGRSLFNKKLKIKSKVMFLLDAILFLFMILTIVTGILISISADNIEVYTILHKFLSWWFLIIISIHIGLHLDLLVNYFKRKFKILNNNKSIQIVFTLVYCIILILSIMSLSKNSIYSKLIPVGIEKNSIKQNYAGRRYQNRNSNNSGNKLYKNRNNIVMENRKNSNIFDVIIIIISFAGGTYYVNKIVNKKIDE